ncbi:MAG TPA: nucleotidyltransferase domain-containing protein [Bacteroidia bacterium]|jgi:predicted nucleotidyltransferase|nr:nucleotidyltransferase domain-containing protein [Bacteroidia bacterium]
MLSRKDAITYSKAFLKECNRLPVKINRAVLFGSTATLKMNKDSDIDIAIFSDSFSDNILKNIDLIGKVAIRFPELDVHTFSNKSYKYNSAIIEEIKKTGISLI